MRHRVIALALLAVISAWADSHFRVQLTPRTDVMSLKQQCDIRLKVDDQVEVKIHKDQVQIHTLSGQDAHNDGSECTAALPGHEAPGFAFQAIDGRGEVRMLAAPSRENDFSAVVRINDPGSGVGRYHFRLTWNDSGVGPEAHRGEKDSQPPPGGPPGFAWNNVTTYSGRGHGESRLGQVSQPLADASVNIDVSGKILVTFTSPVLRGEKPKRVVFTGMVMERGENRMKADMVTEDSRLHGTMTLSVDKQNLNDIALDATNGQDHLHLTWERR